ncbi:unnamed protein product [Rangifer tarandus platyrhynchus]|uniref:Uncharacterized protein n=1 Tax=Rangifer tarandus platyrhynchus TaxID=3082113 RepID=A0AC59Z5X7_RANTA
MRAESGPAPVHSCPGDVTGHAPGVSEGAGPAPRGGGEALWALGTRWRPQVLAGQALTSELCSATSETHKCPEKQDSTPSAEEGKELQKGSAPGWSVPVTVETRAPGDGDEGPGARDPRPRPALRRSHFSEKPVHRGEEQAPHTATRELPARAADPGQRSRCEDHRGWRTGMGCPSGASLQSWQELAITPKASGSRP